MSPATVILRALFLVICAAPAACFADPVDLANSLRSRGCGGLPAVDEPLQRQAQLDEAAEKLAAGADLQTATLQAGYRAKAVALVHLRTTSAEAGITRLLEEDFCDIVADAGLEEAGFFQRGNDTWMLLAKPLSPPRPEGDSSVGEQVLELVNAARAQARTCGREHFPAAGPLERSAALERAAAAHAEDMAEQMFMSHEGTDGSMPAERVTRAGYAWIAVAENVAAGQTTPEQVVDSWLSSAGHCANLMSSRYSQTGAAHAVNLSGKRAIYWVQVYAAPATNLPAAVRE